MDQGSAGAQRETTHFHALDGLRGVAALAVLLGHASSLGMEGSEGWVPRKSLAVLFFFMLSGFVVGSAYQQRLRDGLSTSNFMLRRVIRLYPLVILGALIGILWYSFFDRQFWVGWRSALYPILNPLLLPALSNPLTGDRFAINPPAWSLFFEMIAYGAFALFLAKTSTKKLVFITLICTAVYAVADWRYMRSIPGRLIIFEVGAAFIGGVLLWRLHEACKLPNWQVPFLALAAAIVLICLCPLTFTPAVDYIALLVVFPAALIFGAARGRHEATTVERVLGDLSYPLYITHWFFVVAAVYFVQPRAGAYVAMGAAIAASIAFAWLAMRFYDVPLRAWLVRRYLAPAR